MIGKFSVVLNFNRLFLELNQFICNQLLVLPDHIIQQPITRVGGDTFKRPIYLLMLRYRWEGRCFGLKTSTIKPCYIICQLGLTLDNVNCVKAGFFKPTFSLS